MRRRDALAGGAAVLAGLLPARTPAQGRWPDRPIRLIVPYSAGGGGDTLARQLAPRLAERLGVPVVVENRPGAGGNLGTEAGLKAPADGYTLVAISSSYPCQAVISRLSFDPLTDYAPIVLLSREPGVLLVRPDFPARSVRELVELARARPGSLAYGSAGMGSQAHFNTEFMAWGMGIRLNHVPYKGTSQAFADLQGGNIQLMFGTPQFAIPQVRGARTRALGIAGPERLGGLPDVPTFAEAGFPFEFIAWNGIIAPRGTPADVVARLNAEINAVTSSRELADKLAADGVGTVGGPPERLSTLIREDIDRWRELAPRAQIRGD
jgi:tripartite-type tricarboxylate transporter receptor subunit TctC